MGGSQVVVVRAVWRIRAGIPHLVHDLVEILTHLVAAQLLAHGLGPSSHALRIVFVDVPESGAIADLLQPAVFGEDLGGTRDQPGQAPTAAIRTLWRRFDGRQAAKENRGPLATREQVANLERQVAELSKQLESMRSSAGTSPSSPTGRGRAET